MQAELLENKHVNILDLTPTECSVITDGLAQYYYHLKTTSPEGFEIWKDMIINILEIVEKQACPEESSELDPEIKEKIRRLMETIK
ncbi:MAG: hypothetical protein ACOCRO_08115 [Halanaerobiales bacterium]